MEVQEVDHGAEAEPVDRVADRAGQDQPEHRARHGPGLAVQPDQEKCADRGRQGGERPGVVVAPANMPKLTPRFQTSTRLKNEVTATGVYGSSPRSTAHLVA